MVLGTKSVRCSARVILASLLLCIASAAGAVDLYPLRPPDMSSPRATLQGFIAATDEIYRRMAGLLEHYAESNRLYLTSGERREPRLQDRGRLIDPRHEDRAAILENDDGAWVGRQNRRIIAS